MAAIYSMLHMLVDGICALSVFGYFLLREDGYTSLLLYNFCAFALQMPLGALLDLQNQNQKKTNADRSLWFALLGVVLTLIGTITHPVVLGVGNALFHVGGGVGTIREDTVKGWRGRGLGVFVAPGALGLYLGTRMAKQGLLRAGLVSATLLLLAGGIAAGILHRRYQRADQNGVLDEKKQTAHIAAEGNRTSCLWLAGCCLSVVILRSYIGMAVSFSWKQIPLLGLLSVLALVCGKAAGGFLAARFGTCKVVVVSLLLAAVGYLGSAVAPIGLIALFCFNMTMPITLYLLICAYPRLPGFCFGLLTFGLFLGFLPSYLGMERPVSGEIVGSVGSLISLVLLGVGIRMGGRSERILD